MFNLSSYDKEFNLIESYAILEVSDDHSLIQDEARYNIKASPKAMNIITRWDQADRIKNKVISIQFAKLI